MNSPFGGTQFVPGLGWVESPGKSGKLAGEPDVMMISGLSNGAHGEPTTASMQSGQVVATTGTFKLGAVLAQRVSIFGLSLPLWVWLLITTGVLGAGWVFFGRKLMKKL